jgi:hypothetical protein
MDAVSGLKEEAKPWYSDQILPFDITLAGTNEMGAATAMKIFGVEILNEGSGMSIDDAVHFSSPARPCQQRPHPQFSPQPSRSPPLRGGMRKFLHGRGWLTVPDASGRRRNQAFRCEGTRKLKSVTKKRKIIRRHRTVLPHMNNVHTTSTVLSIAAL